MKSGRLINGAVACYWAKARALWCWSVRPLPDNAASNGLLRKLGFRFSHFTQVLPDAEGSNLYMMEFEPTAWVSPMKLRRLDRTGVYAVAATRLALQDAGHTVPAEGDDASGVVLGTWTAGGQSTHQFVDALFRSGPAGACGRRRC